MITSEFFFKFNDLSDKNKASEPLLHPTAYLVLQNFAKFFSKFITYINYEFYNILTLLMKH